MSNNQFQQVPQFQQPQHKRGIDRWAPWIVAGFLFVGGVGIGASIVGTSSIVAAPEQSSAPTVTATATSTATATKTVTASAKPAPASTATATVTVTETAEAVVETSSENPGSNAPSQEWPDGTYEIGTGKDIVPGTYKAVDVAEFGCYVEQSKDASGDFSSLITNDIITGPGYVTVLAKANYLTVQGCTLIEK